MEKSDSIRERLLTRLPQPDELTAYREEVAVLLAKHKKALFWERVISKELGACAIAFFLLTSFLRVRGYLDLYGLYVSYGVVALLMVTAIVQDARYRIRQDHMGLLKEIKQLQLQVLELQSAVQRTEDE